MLKIVAFGTNLSTFEEKVAKTVLSTPRTLPSMIIILIAGGAISVTLRRDLGESWTKITLAFMVHRTAHSGARLLRPPQLNTGLVALNKTFLSLCTSKVWDGNTLSVLLLIYLFSSFDFLSTFSEVLSNSQFASKLEHGFIIN